MKNPNSVKKRIEKRRKRKKQIKILLFTSISLILILICVIAILNNNLHDYNNSKKTNIENSIKILDI